MNKCLTRIANTYIPILHAPAHTIAHSLTQSFTLLSSRLPFRWACVCVFVSVCISVFTLVCLSLCLLIHMMMRFHQLISKTKWVSSKDFRWINWSKTHTHTASERACVPNEIVQQTRNSHFIAMRLYLKVYFMIWWQDYKVCLCVLSLAARENTECEFQNIH